MPAEDIAWAVDDIRARIPNYRLYHSYWAGSHRLTFATEKFLNTFGRLFQEFADNLCDDVVDEPVSRMRILGWSATGPDLGQACADLWDANRGGSRAREVHRAAFTAGDGWIITGLDPNQQPRMYPQRPDQMAVRYDPDRPDEPAVAAKVWLSGRRYRLTLYYPDHLERWATKGTSPDGGIPKAGAFIPYDTPDEPAEVGYPWGMPVWHFPNDALSGYGRSVLTDVIPLQDALNKSVADMLVAMESHALPQRWGTGITLERDPETGQEINPFKSGAERFWRTSNSDSQFGQFPPTDMAGFLAVQRDFRLEIARKGALPPYAVDLAGSASVPSGVSLLVMEGRQVKRVTDAQEAWTPNWQGVMAQLLTMAGMPATSTDLDVEWAPPGTRDEQTLVQVLLAKRELGVSERQTLLELGYDDAKIDQMLDERATLAADTMLTSQITTGGRTTPVTGLQAETLAQSLGLTPAPAAPPGTSSPLAG